MRRQDLPPLPSHKLLPEAFPPCRAFLIADAQFPGCRIGDPGTSRSARIIVTAFRGELTL
jgi:hypothetical protein